MFLVLFLSSSESRQCFDYSATDVLIKNNGLGMLNFPLQYFQKNDQK